MTFKRILVGLDQSFKDSWVFSRALEQAKPHLSSLLITHCLRAETDFPTAIPTGVTQDQRALDMYETLRRRQQRKMEQEYRKAQDWLQLYFQQAIAKGIPTRVECNIGLPEVQICELAERWNADLLVVGHREHRGIRQMARDSVSDYILHHAPCSVLVIHGVATPDFDREYALNAHELDTVPELDRFNHPFPVSNPRHIAPPPDKPLTSRMQKL
ncbi:MAG: universal stress protein [Synechococcales bacterium]|nr:universal stress protein [Synechococcales bacterium]